MEETREIIVRLLKSMGGRKEVEQYLKQFSSVDSQKFAIIKVGGAIVDDELDELASALTFLQRVGLYPIVLHGAGPQLNRTLEEAGIQTQRIDGMRITEGPVLEIARRVFQGENLRIVDALEARGTRARPITSGVFEAEFLDYEKLGYVGNITKVHLDSIRSSIRSGHLPIIAPLGETAQGQIVNINADIAARELSAATKPFKIVFLTTTGGLLDQNEELIPAINLCEDFEYLMSQDWVHSGMRLKLQQVHDILGPLPLESSVSITSPAQLPRELFTHSGSGTLVRMGEKVDVHTHWDDVDTTKLKSLLEACFGRALTPDYFETRALYRLYLTSSYRATAILSRESDIPYLDKFAVTQRAQGEGLGRSLWNRMREDEPKLFWRSRRQNPINSWYFSQADGSVTRGIWTVFWYGLEDFDEIRDCVERAANMPPTLTDHAFSE